MNNLPEDIVYSENEAYQIEGNGENPPYLDETPLSYPDTMKGIPHGGCNWTGCKDCFPDETPLPIGYGDEWDGSARNQSNDFFIGHSGHVTILWHVTNNPYEKYDSSKSYHTSALDGSALYIWCDLKFTYPDAFAQAQETRIALREIDSQSTIHHL